MKNFNYLLSVIIIVLFFVNISVAQKVSYSDSWGNQGFQITKENTIGVNVNYSITEFTFANTNIKGEEMKNIFLHGVMLPNDEGAPDLPSSGKYIAIPQGAKAILRVKTSKIETFTNVNIAPAPRIPLDTEKGPLEYNKNEAIYSKDAFYPAQAVQLSKPLKLRGVDATVLGISPFQYNPVTKELRVYRDIEIEITFEGGNNHFGEDRLRSRWFDPILEDAFLNHSSLPKIDYTKRFLNPTDEIGCEYLIVSPDGANFQSWADSIRTFRIQQGIVTEVVTLSDIGGNTAPILENYFNDAYNIWDIPPVAVLLLGDFGNSMDNRVIAPIWNNYCASDNIYADVDGDDLPEIIFARMTARDNSELEVMITKFLDYERNPPTSADYYNHPITALGWQTARWFQICSESIGGYLKNVQGKDPVRINAVYQGNPNSDPWSTATNTSTVVNYFGPNGQGYIPATPGELGGWNGGNATSVNNAINDGAFLLQHRDHGGVSGWGEPAYNSGDIDGLTNTDLTFVFSINCLTGKYNSGNECFAEKFHRYTYNGQNSGALGIIAASEVSYSFVNDTYVWGMYDNMWPDFMPDMGTTPESRGIKPAFGNAAGKIHLSTSSWPYNTSNKTVTYHLFHHHGDAFMNLYSEVPTDLSVTHAGIVLGGLDFFTIQVDEDAFVALTVGDQIIGTCVGAGVDVPVDISILPQLPGTVVRLTITKQNYYRYSEDLMVISPDGAYCIYNSRVINDNSGNGNSIPEFGESIYLSLIIQNLGNLDALNSDITIAGYNQYITLTDTSELYPLIPANDTASMPDGYSFDIADNIPDQEKIHLDITITDELDSTWLNSTTITINAPVISIGNLTVNDVVGGNGNGRLDAGETAEIRVMNTNSGHSFATNSIAYINTDCNYIEVLNTVDSIETIGLFGGKIARFEVVVDDDAPNGVIIADFDYEIVSNAYQEEHIFPVKIGLLVEDFETGNFLKYNWTYAGDEPWAVTTQYPYEGYYSAKSGNIGNSEKSELILTLETMFADSISFIRKVSSANDHNLKFYINNTLKDEWSGTSEGWVREAFYVGIGNYTFKWVYQKSGGATAGSDCAWLDYIIMPPIMTLTCYAGYDDYTCEGDNYQCEGEATDWVSVEWTTSGTGTFDDNTILDPVYTPSADDITAGSVILTIETVDNNGESVDDEMILTIDFGPVAPEMPSGTDYVDVFLIASSEYTTSPVVTAYSYIWNIDPVDAGIISGDSTIGTVIWDEDYLGIASISVKGVGECGEGEYSEAFEVTVDNTTSTPENENNKVFVYPNPTSGNLNIEWMSENFNNVKIEIFNMLGTKIYHKDNIQSKGAFKHTINLDELSKGVYFLIIKGDDIQFNKKIIIQK